MNLINDGVVVHCATLSRTIDVITMNRHNVISKFVIIWRQISSLMRSVALGTELANHARNIGINSATGTKDLNERNAGNTPYPLETDLYGRE